MLSLNNMGCTMPRFRPLGIKKAQAERFTLLPRAREFGVDAGPDRLGPFSFSWSSRNGGTGAVTFRNLLVASVIRTRDGWGVSVRDEVPESADGVIAQGVLNAVAVCDEIGRVRRNDRPAEADDYCARITAKGDYNLTGWDGHDAYLALLGLADHRPGEAFIGPVSWGKLPDSVIVLGARPVSAHVHVRRSEPVRVRSFTGDRIISEPVFRALLTEGRERFEVARAGPGEAFEGLRDAARADDLSIRLLWEASDLGQRAQPGRREPARHDFGPFSVSVNADGFIAHAHAGVIYAWGRAGPRFFTEPAVANEGRALMGLAPLPAEPLRWALRAGAAALLRERLDSLLLPDEGEINDEAIRLGM